MKKLLLFTAVLLSLTAIGQTDLIISEYIEGSGNNKALELYNPTSETIDLTKYIVVRFSNGESYPANLDPKTTSGGYLELLGTLAPGECHVIVNGQTEDSDYSPACDPDLQAMADQLDNDYPAPTYMNGNDAIGLLKTEDGSTYTAVDIFGEIGLGSSMDNGYGWSDIKDTVLTYTASDVEVNATIANYVVPATADDGSSFGPYWMAWSKDHTLIRKPGIVDGVTSNPSPFSISQEWDTLPAVQITDSTWSYKDIWTNLGKHDIDGVSITTKKSNIQQTTLYPNPVSGNSFTVRSNTSNISYINIFNTVGQRVAQFSAINKHEFVINTTAIRKGIYLVEIKLNDSSINTRKLIVR